MIKIFFQNIKRGGILLVQMAVGSLYMFSVPRGYTDGFNQWCKQVAAICLTAFMPVSYTHLLIDWLSTDEHNATLRKSRRHVDRLWELQKWSDGQ